MRNPQGAPELETAAAREKLPITVLPMDVDDDGSVIEAIGRVCWGALDDDAWYARVQADFGLDAGQR